MTEWRTGCGGGVADGALRRRLIAGAGVWVGFCVAAVILRGVRWDENYEFAQAALRLVPYPEGHPLLRHARGLFSVQLHVTALLLGLTDSAGLVCGLRNVLFMAGTVLPAYLAAGWLTGRAVWGHVAAALTLLGFHTAFYGVYPQMVWPQLYSNGHIGTAWAVLTVACLACGFSRAGFLLAGLMPAVHLGQAPPVLCLAAVYAAHGAWRGERTVVLRAVRYGGGALVLSALLWGGQRVVWPAPGAEAGGYVAEIDPMATWRWCLERFSGHRSLYGGTVPYVMAGFLLLMAGAAGNARRVGPFAWFFIYGAFVAGAVWGIMLVHAIMGAEIPYWFLNWLPYRLANHLPPLLVIASIAVVAHSGAAWIIPAVLAYGLLRPLLPGIMGVTIYDRYLASGEGALYLMWGAAMAAVALRPGWNRGFRAAWLAAGLGALVFLAMQHQFGTACSVVGFVATCAMTRWRFLQPGRTLERVAAVGAVAVTVALVLEQACAREHLPVTPFEREVRAFLASRGEGDAMIAGDYQQKALQARTGHPMLVDEATMTWAGYRPDLAPVIAQIHADVYGLAMRPGMAEDGLAWFERWAGRTPEDWAELGARYGFRFVLAPAFAPLRLQRVLGDESQALYEVPEVEGGRQG